MGDGVKGLHYYPRVPVTCSIMISSPVLEVTWSSRFDLVQVDVRCDRGEGCSTFMSPSLDMCLYLSRRLQPGLCLGVQFILGHPCDSHVRYDLSHSNDIYE